MTDTLAYLHHICRCTKLHFHFSTFFLFILQNSNLTSFSEITTGFVLVSVTTSPLIIGYKLGPYQCFACCSRFTTNHVHLSLLSCVFILQIQMLANKEYTTHAIRCEIYKFCTTYTIISACIHTYIQPEDTKHIWWSLWYNHLVCLKIKELKSH